MKFAFITSLLLNLASTWAEVNAQLAQKLDIIIAQLGGLENGLQVWKRRMLI